MQRWQRQGPDYDLSPGLVHYLDDLRHVASPDARGSFLDDTYVPADPQLEKANRVEMTEDVVYLTEHQRAIVDAALVAECQAQG
jgi:hypothetical protein